MDRLYGCVVVTIGCYHLLMNSFYRHPSTFRRMENKDDTKEHSDDSVESDSSLAPSNVKFGCRHYKRRCSFVSPCCNKIYPCRLCHDDEETHAINRHAVMYIVCQLCNTQQAVASNCVSCGVQFGKYFCAVCRMYDDTDKQQFHCDQCGICRVGGREKFFHCTVCDMCLAIDLKNSHKCVENAAHSNCPVCMESLHSSVSNMIVPKCGHIMHRKCWVDMLKSGNYACAICCQSMTDLSEFWLQLDNEVANTPMPDEYKDMKVWILCRDCHKKSNVVFHVVGLKCMDCGSYNTCRDGEPSSVVGAGNNSDDKNTSSH